MLKPHLQNTTSRSKQDHQKKLDRMLVTHIRSYHSVVSQTLTQYEQSQGRFGQVSAQEHHANTNLASPRISERREAGTIQESHVIHSGMTPPVQQDNFADLK